MDDDLIWRGMVVQVMVVGGVRPVEEHFFKSAALQAGISYSRLTSLLTDAERNKAINAVLREATIRYASEELAKCRKTSAIAHNYELVSQQGGPRAFAKKLSLIADDQQRIGSVMGALDYVKSKGARDFLMTHGLLEEALALDSRLVQVLERLGMEIDKRFKNKEIIYAQEEQRLLSTLCRPLGMKGVEFDRMLFQNYSRILGEL